MSLFKKMVLIIGLIGACSNGYAVEEVGDSPGGAKFAIYRTPSESHKVKKIFERLYEYRSDGINQALQKVFDGRFSRVYGEDALRKRKITLNILHSGTWEVVELAPGSTVKDFKEFVETYLGFSVRVIPIRAPVMKPLKDEEVLDEVLGESRNIIAPLKPLGEQARARVERSQKARTERDAADLEQVIKIAREVFAEIKAASMK